MHYHTKWTRLFGFYHPVAFVYEFFVSIASKNDDIVPDRAFDAVIDVGLLRISRVESWTEKSLFFGISLALPFFFVSGGRTRINVARRGERRAEADGCAALFLRDAIESFSFPQIMHRATIRAAGREVPERERERQSRSSQKKKPARPQKERREQRGRWRERERARDAAPDGFRVNGWKGTGRCVCFCQASREKGGR